MLCSPSPFWEKEQVPVFEFEKKVPSRQNDVPRWAACCVAGWLAGWLAVPARFCTPPSGRPIYRPKLPFRGWGRIARKWPIILLIPLCFPESLGEKLKVLMVCGSRENLYRVVPTVTLPICFSFKMERKEYCIQHTKAYITDSEAQI